VRIGTRASALALAQSGWVRDALAGRGLKAELVPIATSGDESRGADAADPGDKSRFTREIEQALLAGDVDLAVHSAKDVPGELPDGLAIVAVPPRADARDALCGAAGSLDDLPVGAVVGTSSLRRRAQLLALRPDLELRELRGNVDTRLRRLADGDYDALVLAAAGLARLGREEGAPVAIETMTPAPGQGCLVIQARSDDARAADATEPLTDRAALVALTAERALVTGVEASCDTPVGAHARAGRDSVLELRAFAGLPDGSAWVQDSVEGDPAEPAELGWLASERLLAAGARELLDEAERVAAGG
jgi:hydroxymethylbilane synthase